jgi:hypothetical protein
VSGNPVSVRPAVPGRSRRQRFERHTVAVRVVMVVVRAALLATARQAMPVGVTSTGRVVAYPRTDARQFGHLAAHA